MKRAIKQPKKRTWMPKKRAETFEDKRTKRQRTRSAQRRAAISEF